MVSFWYFDLFILTNNDVDLQFSEVIKLLYGFSKVNLKVDWLVFYHRVEIVNSRVVSWIDAFLYKRN